MRSLSVLFLAVFVALTASGCGAAVREISGSELRKIVKAGEAVSLKRAIEAVEASLGGVPIEARAFDAEGVFYRIVMKRPNGTLFSIIIDAGTGREVAKDSPVGKEISAAAATAASTKSSQGKSQSAGSNGNANGNADGNRGGNGNGGGSGNGNSNGNGNGNGNGGGNGNGNKKN